MSPISPEQRAEPGVHLQTLWRRKWTVLLTTLVGCGAAIGLTQVVVPTYSATAKVLLQASPAAQVLGNTQASSPNNIQDDITLLESPGVTSLVRRRLGSAPAVDATNESGSDVIDITASSHQPAAAARIANAYANAYVFYLRAQDVNNLQSAASAVQGRITALDGQLATLGAGQGRSGLGGSSTQVTSPQEAAIDQQIVVLEQQLSTLQSDAALASAGASVLQPATVPGAPSSPKKTENALLGLFGGLVLGTALAYVREALDDTIVTRDDLDKRHPRLPVLAQIPQFPSRKKTSELITAARPHSDAAEAFRILRTSVQFGGLERPLRTLLVTSPRSTEGKTTAAANLAVTLAQTGQRIVLVDCDLRRPGVHRPFELTNQVGFTSVVLGEVPLSSALQEVPGQANLRLLASGAHVSNPSELLAGQSASEVITSVAQTADLVIIDSPPVLPVTDPVTLAPRVDATLLVVQAGMTTAKDLARSLEVLGQVDASILGCVLNFVRTSGRYGYRYGGYRYGYYSYPDSRPEEPVRPRQGAHAPRGR